MVIQEVKIRYKTNVDRDTILKDFRTFTEKYLIGREGFVNRFYFKNPENIWMLYIFYDNRANALKSISDYQKWETSHDILIKLEKDGLVFHHYDMDEPLLNNC